MKDFDFPSIKKLTGIIEIEMSDGEKKTIEINPNNMPILSFSTSVNYDRYTDMDLYALLIQPPEPITAKLNFDIEYLLKTDDGDIDGYLYTETRSHLEKERS